MLLALFTRIMQMVSSKDITTQRGALLNNDYRFNKCRVLLQTMMTWKFPRLSQRVLMHVKHKLRCVVIAFAIYVIFCFVVSKTPDARHIQAIKLTEDVMSKNEDIGKDDKKAEEAASPPIDESFWRVEPQNVKQPQVKFVISNPTKCAEDAPGIQERNRSPRPHLLILVSSKLNNADSRSAIRSTWGSYTTLHDYRVTVMFLLAVDSKEEQDPDLMSSVQLENLIKNDLIVGRFKDNYRNMTKKTMMGLQWFNSFCPSADIVLKTDDDVFLVFDNLYKPLKKLQPVTMFGYCTANRTFVNRDPRSSTYVSYFDWNEPTVPRYCFGIAYGMDNYLAKLVYKTGQEIPYFPVEDIFVGVAIEASKVRVKFDYWNQNYTLHADQMAFGLSYCNRRFSIAFHQLNPMELHMVHNQFNAGKNLPNFCDGDPEKYKLRNFQKPQ